MQSVYLGIKINNDGASLYITGEGIEYEYVANEFKDRLEGFILSFVKDFRIKNNVNFIAAGICSEIGMEKLGSDLWLLEDIVPFLLASEIENAKDAAFSAKSNFDEDNNIVIKVMNGHEVEVSFLVDSDVYKSTVPVSKFDEVASLRDEFSGKCISFISATPKGGGVAIMRHAVIRLFRLLGVNAHWYVLSNRPEAFIVTKKKFHDILQNVGDKNAVLNENDKRIYNEWIDNNAKELENVFVQSDVIVIDDPQPSGLIPHIKSINPKAKVIYRSHIQIDSELIDEKGSSASKTWEYIWDRIKDIDLFISHPDPSFVPSDVPKDKVLYLPPSTDQFDGLNKDLTEWQEEYYMQLFDKLLIDNHQEPLDKNKPYIIQIARFDPSKGIHDVVNSYYLLCEKLGKADKQIPQLIIAGNKADDDPESAMIYKDTFDLINTLKFRNLKNNINVITLPYNDQLLNALVRKSYIVLQLSHAEGYEIKVTESLMKSKPVIGYYQSGVSLQIKDGETGYLLNLGDIEGVSNKLFDLFTNLKLYSVMSKNASTKYNKECFTLPNVAKWLYISNILLKGEEIENKNLPEIY